MKKLMQFAIFFFILVTFGCQTDSISSVSESSQNIRAENRGNIQGNNQNVVSLNQSNNLIVEANSPENKRLNYIGCWKGMRGGKLKITSNKIYDLGSKEESSYIERPLAKKESEQGLQTGEEYLLEADGDFPKSFLTKVIRIAFNNDGTVGIITYESYEDYLKDNFVGQGLFEKISCE